MIKENLAVIQNRISNAAKKVGRDSGEITLIAVSKTYPVEDIKEVMLQGTKHFGENKVQELTKKIPEIEGEVCWHLIGHLQTNKVKYIVGQVELIHSVDSIRLVNEIEKQSAKKGVISDILLEVNMAKEVSKHGIYPEEVQEMLDHIATLPHVRMKGLMTVAPYVEDPEDNREIFRKLYNLSVDIQKQNIDNISTDILSMGMSNDFEVAIEEGATMVRVGTAIFGKREYAK